MKRPLKIYLTSATALIIPTVIFTSTIGKILIEEPQTNFETTPFSYKQNNNEEKGFDHINLKQYKLYNPVSQKYEIFLNEIGQKYLIDRFMETTMIGPEIGSMKSITIGSREVDKESLGSYYPVAKSIFISVDYILKKYKFLFNKTKGADTQEQRAEAILPTLVHEYSHHIFTTYGGSPIGYNGSSVFLDPNIYVQKTTNRQSAGKNNLTAMWNKRLYDEFKKIFFSGNGLKNNEFAKWYQTEIQDESFLLEEFNVKELFKIANEYADLASKPKQSDDEEFVQSLITINGESKSLKIRFKDIAYYYSMSEQVVRKLLLSTFIENNKPNISKVSKEYYDDNYFSAFYYKSDKDKTEEWIPFFDDYVFPNNYFKNSSLKYNNTPKSKQFVSDIFQEMVGYKLGANLTWMSANTSWEIKSSNSGLVKKPESIYEYSIIKDLTFLKIGGFIDTKDFKYVGYIDDTTKKFVPLSKIEINPYGMWYKYSLKDKKRKVQVNHQNNFYWYSRKYIDKNDIIGKKLYFAKSESDPKPKPLSKIRANKYGIVNNYNTGLIHDINFGKLLKDGNRNNDKWLYIGSINGGKVEIIHYNKQEEVEKIWQSNNNQ